MPDPTAADWSWQDDPDVVSWDHRQGPDLTELTEVLARHGVTVIEVDTGTDDVAVCITRLGAQNPPADPPSVAVEPPAAPGAGTDTPEAAEGESGRSLTWPEAIAEVREDTARIEARRAAQVEREAALYGDTPEAPTAAHGPGSGFPHVAGRCPACRWASLFLGAGGHVTCSRLDCPDPVRADQMLHGELPRVDTRCDTCSGTGWIKQEGQIGVPGSGCTHGCPDCEVGRDRLERGELLDPDDVDAPEAHSGAEGLILGRLVTRPDGLWWSDGDCYWHNVRHLLGGATEALLVPVEAGPVLEAALRLVRAWDADPFSPQTAAAKAALGAAVDALRDASRDIPGAEIDSAQVTTPPQLDTAADVATSRTGAHEEQDGGISSRCSAARPGLGQCELRQGHAETGDPQHRHRTGNVQWLTDAQIEASDAPEPAGDGPGWDRDRIGAILFGLRLVDRRPDLPVYPSPGDADQIRALLAERDHLVVVKLPKLARAAAEAEQLVEDAYRSMTEAERQRDAARAEAATAWEAAGDMERIQREAEEARAELALAQETLREVTRADRDGAADTLSRLAAKLATGSLWADPFGRWTADQAEAAGAQKQLMVDRVLAEAAEVRFGERQDGDSDE